MGAPQKGRTQANVRKLGKTIKTLRIPLVKTNFKIKWQIELKRMRARRRPPAKSLNS